LALYLKFFHINQVVSYTLDQMYIVGKEEQLPIHIRWCGWAGMGYAVNRNFTRTTDAKFLPQSSVSCTSITYNCINLLTPIW